MTATLVIAARIFFMTSPLQVLRREWVDRVTAVAPLRAPAPAV
jgi:hypothetical protein